jgi:hypothetical protein
MLDAPSSRKLAWFGLVQREDFLETYDRQGVHMTYDTGIESMNERRQSHALSSRTAAWLVFILVVAPAVMYALRASSAKNENVASMTSTGSNSSPTRTATPSIVSTLAPVRVGRYLIEPRRWARLQKTLACWASRGSWRDVNASGNYSWAVSSTCPLSELYGAVNETMLCSRLRAAEGRAGTALWIGDSIQRQFFDFSGRPLTLKQATDRHGFPPFHEPVYQSRNCTPSNERHQVAQFGSGENLCGLTAISRRADRLLLNTSVQPFQCNGGFLDTTWAGDAPEAALIILNRGAHYTNDTLYLDGWRAALDHVRSVAPDAIVVARTTPPGHLDCFKFTAPLRSPPSITKQFNWADFGRQNALLRALVKDAFPGVLLFDVELMAALRPDVHVGRDDCLHFDAVGHLQPRALAFMNELFLMLKSVLSFVLDSGSLMYSNRTSYVGDANELTIFTESSSVGALSDDPQPHDSFSS